MHALALVPRFALPYRAARAMLGDAEGSPELSGIAYDDASPGTLLGAARAEWRLASPFPGQAQLQTRANTYGAAPALRSVGVHARHYIEGYSPKRGAGSILILDEASMVGGELLALCQQAYRTIILVGDPGQLPPINDVAVLHSVEGFSLNAVHRQQERSHILTLAYDVRSGTVRWHGPALQHYAPEVLSADSAPAQ